MNRRKIQSIFNNKGFVFVETIVTVVFISFTLLILYRTFNNIMINERKRIFYDDIVYVYRTYYLKQFVETLDYTKITNKIDNDSYILAIPPSREDVLYYDENLQDYYESFFNNLDINKLSISKFNFDQIKSCASYSLSIASSSCMPLASYSKDEIDYLKTLSSADNYSGYRFIASFNKTKTFHDKATNTDKNIIITYSAWLKLANEG